MGAAKDMLIEERNREAMGEKCERCPAPWRVVVVDRDRIALPLCYPCYGESLRNGERLIITDGDLCIFCGHEPRGGGLLPYAGKDCPCWCHSPLKSVEYPECPICGLELWLEYDEQGREHWDCPEPEKHPEGSETINGENIAPPYRYVE